MNHPNALIRIRLFAVLTTGLLLSSCTHVIKPPRSAYTGYPPIGKQCDLKLGLVLSDELRNAKWERKSMGDTWVIPIGESLATNSETLARRIFREVRVSAAPSAFPPGAVDAVLTPRLAYINRTMGATSFGKSIVAIKLEWTLTNLSGQTLWADTLSGEASGSTGWTNPEKLVEESLEDVLNKSFVSISNAEPIRRRMR